MWDVVCGGGVGVGVGVFVGVSVGVDVHFSNKYPAIRSLADFGRFANNYSLIEVNLYIAISV